METRKVFRDARRGRYPVLILPMRNGNTTYKKMAAEIPSKVLILPMRNGNVQVLKVTKD